MNPNPQPPPAEHQFKPGQSGNPNGAPKGKRISTIMKELLEKELEGPDPSSGQYRKMTMAEIIALAMVKEASTGNVKAAKEVMDRTEGKVPQPLTGEGGAPLLPPVISVAPYSSENRQANIEKIRADNEARARQVEAEMKARTEQEQPPTPPPAA